MDLSERVDGPALYALRGDDDGQSQFRLGTREYRWHQHVRGQLFCVDSGFVQVRTRHGAWMLPPHRAGWIPPGESHQVSVSGAMSGWSLLVAPRAARSLPAAPCVIGISEVMLALVRRAVDWQAPDALDARQNRMTGVLLDEVRHAPHEPLHLPLPQDRRLLRITNALGKQPGHPRTLDEWAAWAGLSPRSLSRLFVGETGLSFAQWRQQARLAEALKRLADGEAVGAIADELGYATPSNFIAMFKRAFGATPARYFKRDGGAFSAATPSPGRG